MRMYDLLSKKKHGEALTYDEIKWMIDEYVAGEIPDYQMSAMLMAIYFQGMNDDEIFAMTDAMAHSGDMVDLSAIDGIKVDKHSTGGVGDKTTLIVGPLVACFDVPVAKMSGRGLGHTGGTVDKLESIPGFNISLPIEKFIENVNNVRISVVGQTGDLAPADKKLYALRDVTATVSCIPLIASSIMSKKIAGGADAIVLDVKYGDGAFMKTIDDAKKLARTMVDIGDMVGRKTIAVISNMNEPLGFAIGNALEVKEAITTLKGNGPKDLEEICIELAANMLYLAKCGEISELKLKLKELLENGKAFNKFKEFIGAQGGNVESIEDVSLLPSAKILRKYNAKKSGYISKIEAEKLGIASMMLGGGRAKKTDSIDYGVGIVLDKKVGDFVKEGEPLLTLHINNEDKVDEAIKLLDSAYEYEDKAVISEKLIADVIS